MRLKKLTRRILLMTGLTYFFAPFIGHAKDLPMHETYSTAKNQSITVAGTRYAYRKLGAATGVPLVLLTHTRGNMDTWDPDLVDSLAKKRPVIAFDYKGTGLTGGKAADSFAEMADDTFAFIKVLDINQVDLLGFSIGGAVAQELLIRHPGLVRRAILAGTSAKGGEGVNNLSERSKSVTTNSKLNAEDFLYAFFAPSPSSQKMGRAYLERIKRRTADNDVDSSPQSLKAQTKARSDWGQPQETPDERLRNVNIPVLVANGKDDIRMPTINSYRLFQMLPKAQLILYPDSGHGFLFQYPELCGNNFSTFLDQAEISDRE